MRLVGRRQAIIAAILRLTISEQGWECQVYRRECHWTASSLTCVVFTVNVRAMLHGHRAHFCRRMRCVGCCLGRSGSRDGALPSSSMRLLGTACWRLLLLCASCSLRAMMHAHHGGCFVGVVECSVIMVALLAAHRARVVQQRMSI